MVSMTLAGELEKDRWIPGKAGRQSYRGKYGLAMGSFTRNLCHYRVAEHAKEFLY